MVSLKKFKNLPFDDKLGILLFLFSFIFLGIILWASFNTSIWMDEAFSLLSIQKPYDTLISITMGDVHPPLYYIILKFIIDFFQNFNLTVNSTIILAKLISVLPTILLFGISIIKIRKNFGWLCFGIFSICLVSMPNFMYYSVDIRMYSWALFFVTVCFIYAYEVLLKSNIKNWTIISLSGVCAAYTHYFAAVSIMMIFSLLLVYFIINNKSEIKKWIMAVVISSLLYSPWLFVLSTQILKVTKSYWIGPITLSVIINYLFFVFSPLSSLPYFSIKLLPIHYFINTFMGLLFAGLYLILLFYFIKSRSKFYNNFILNGVLVVFLTIFFGVLVSVLVKPVFFNRYIFPSLGAFWLTFSFLLSKSWSYKKIFVPALIVMLSISCISTIAFIDYETVAQNDYDKLDFFLKQDSIKNDKFIVDGTETNILPEFNTIRYLLKGYHKIEPSDELNPQLGFNKTVWLFSSESRDYVLKNFEKRNLTIEKYTTFPGIGFSGVYMNKPYNLYKIST